MVAWEGYRCAASGIFVPKLPVSRVDFDKVLFSRITESDSPLVAWNQYSQVSDVDVKYDFRKHAELPLGRPAEVDLVL